MKWSTGLGLRCADREERAVLGVEALGHVCPGHRAAAGDMAQPDRSGGAMAAAVVAVTGTVHDARHGGRYRAKLWAI